MNIVYMQLVWMMVYNESLRSYIHYLFAMISYWHSSDHVKTKNILIKALYNIMCEMRNISDIDKFKLYMVNPLLSIDRWLSFKIGYHMYIHIYTIKNERVNLLNNIICIIIINNKTN